MNLKKIALLLLVALHFFIFWKINLLQLLLGAVQLWDFDVYYQTAIDVRNGAHPYQLPYMQTAGPPLVIAPFLPFSFVSLQLARSLISACSLVGLFCSCWLLAKKIFSKDPLIFALLLNAFFLLTFQPRFNFILGQPNLILMFFITLVLTLPTYKTMGVIFAVITIFKSHYSTAWISLLKKKLSVLLIAGISVSIVFLLTSPILKPTFYVDYLSSRFSQHIAQPLVLEDVGYYNQSLRAALARLYLPNTFAILSGIILVAGGWYVFKSGDQAGGFLLSLLISPVVWQHYMVITYPIIFITALEFAKQKRLPWHLLTAAILLFAHIPWLHEKPLSIPLGILASHYFFGVLLLFYSRFQLYRSNHLAV